MKYKGISRSNGKLVHALMNEGASFDIGNYVEDLGSGPSFDTATIDSVRAEIEKIMDDHPDGKVPGREFDANASVAVHQCLSLPPEIASDPKFWRWLALVEFPDIVEWRHPGKDGISKAENYGIGTIWNNLLARLWYRAEIAYSERDDDPYKLVRCGDVDIWRSHILRVNSGSCRNYSRALLRYQYPDPESSTLTTNEIRELVKRVKRIQVTVALELLSEDDAFALVERLSTAVREEMSASQ